MRNEEPATCSYRPMMSEERAQRLREWHETAIAEGRREETLTLTHLGWTFVVPPEVYAPHPLGLAEMILGEVKVADRVLDMGTGSGVNAIAAASRASDVLAVDVNPIAVECARNNAELNGLASTIVVRESDVFENVSGRFDLIIFDPPFRWFRGLSIKVGHDRGALETVPGKDAALPHGSAMRECEDAVRRGLQPHPGTFGPSWTGP